MHTITPLANLSGLALMLAFGTGALAQDIFANAQVGATAGHSAEIVISDDNIINILVDDGSAKKMTNFMAGADPGSEVQRGGMIAVPHGNNMSKAVVSESGTKMVTTQELNTVVSADAITLNTMPEMNFETGNVTIKDNSFHGGVNTMTITTAPTNAIINTTSITMHVTMSMQ